ncbi:MAG: glycerol-3-phosphate dehydrogenase [Kiloniellales bacterium]|nr:glycerol-3-phosphate dehydrogenase [Kiloniellales bacterium]
MSGPVMAKSPIYDLLIVGGGINGAGIARDAAGRGLKVLLCEQHDLASATSSASTKLIHGGLRYLEYFEFRLVREALIEREVLLRAAPHIIWPMTFVLPHARQLRPAWMVRLGLWLYDHLGGRERLPGSRGLDLTRDPLGGPLAGDVKRGFSYADCWVEDSRLVVLNALDARERGAEIRTRTRCVSARRRDGLWEMDLAPSGGEAAERIRARIMINAAGPWVSETLTSVASLNAKSAVRMIKGSHIVVPRLYDGEQSYILQNTDRRVVFLIPYEQRFTLIGTTDVPYDGDPAEARIADDETRYLCDAANRYLAQQIGPEDVIWSYAGVRPLYDDASENASAVTRDYVLDIDADDGAAPLLSVFGGKITTYRKLAEHALAKLSPWLEATGDPWTAEVSLPGGDMPDADFDAYLERFQGAHPWLPPALARRYLRAYGTRAERIVGRAAALDDLGEALGDGLYEAELRYLVDQEWAQTAEDILWRRSKLGLHCGAETRARLDDWIARRATAAAERIALP